MARAKPAHGKNGSRQAREGRVSLVRHPPAEDAPRGLSATAVAAEALRSGFLPCSRPVRDAIPRAGEAIRVGDPDDDALANEYVGEDVPGASTPTPDQNDVDAIGRVYGLQEEDTGALRSGSEVLRRRDRRRSELRAPGRPRY